MSKVTDEKDPLHGAIPILSTVKTVLDKKTGKKKFVCDILTKNKETKVLDIYYAEDQKEEQTNMEKEKDVFDRVEDMAKTKTPEQIAKELDTANKEKK